MQNPYRAIHLILARHILLAHAPGVVLRLVLRLVVVVADEGDRFLERPRGVVAGIDRTRIHGLAHGHGLSPALDLPPILVPDHAHAHAHAHALAPSRHPDLGLDPDLVLLPLVLVVAAAVVLALGHLLAAAVRQRSEGVPFRLILRDPIPLALDLGHVLSAVVRR